MSVGGLQGILDRCCVPQRTPGRNLQEFSYTSIAENEVIRMSTVMDLTGQRFGRLVVVERAENDSHNKARWRCRCDCGKETLAMAKSLRSGSKKSCGCLEAENRAAIKTRGGCDVIHGATDTRLYRIWWAMKTRCYNKNHRSFPNYGGRGITVCAEWLHDFTAFQKWSMAHGYADDLSIDRIDNDRGYSPDNCRWATDDEQRHNKRK